MKSKSYFLALFLFFIGSACHAQAYKSVDDYKAEAEAAVKVISVEDAKALVGGDSVVFVDVREADEIARIGKIEDAIHVPRGVLEFYIDPKSAMHLDVFSSGKKVVFYCATGGRSLLATKVAKDMGVKDPVYLEGGYKVWMDGDASADQ